MTSQAHKMTPCCWKMDGGKFKDGSEIQCDKVQQTKQAQGILCAHDEDGMRKKEKQYGKERKPYRKANKQLICISFNQYVPGK